MDRQTTLLMALGTLIAAALAVGVGGWILLVRDRKLAKQGAASDVVAPVPGDVSHPGATEGS